MDDELPPIDDPYLRAPEVAPAPRGQLSLLALTSVLSAVFLGPLGAVAAIVFGWAARRHIERSWPRRTGYTLATLGMALGSILTIAWGASLSFIVWKLRHNHVPAIVASGPSAPLMEPGQPIPDPMTAPAPVAPADPQPGSRVPKNTTVQREGAVTVVDVGVSASALSEELAKQRAAAALAGETMLVMTTREPCAPCIGFERSLSNSLMQTALSKVRLLRVDIDVFKDDLDALKIPRNVYPGFFLMALDLTPRDGIDGGEWDDDIAANIAPVLGAFVRGKYKTRRKNWQPLPGSGTRL